VFVTFESFRVRNGPCQREPANSQTERLAYCTAQSTITAELRLLALLRLIGLPPTGSSLFIRKVGTARSSPPPRAALVAERAHCPLVITLQGHKAATESHYAVGASVPTFRVRNLEGLLSIAEDVPNGLVLVRAESFGGPDDLSLWRSVHPFDWMTVLLLSVNAASLCATLSWLTNWPLPVLLDQPTAETLVDSDADALAQHAADVRESCRMVRYFAPRLMAASPIVAAHLLAAYASPRMPNSLKQLAADCHMSERHIRRLLLTLGIPSSYLYFSASRVLRAYGDVFRGELPFTEIARRHGFGTRRTLRAQWWDVTGAPLERARGIPLTDAMLASLARRVVDPLW
jgi:methylphosphotriester-DNA--protein-cysteine methyltransferase